MVCRAAGKRRRDSALSWEAEDGEWDEDSGALTWVRDTQTLAPAPPLLSSSPCAQRGGWGLCRGEEKVCEAHMTSSQSPSPLLLYLPLSSPEPSMSSSQLPAIPMVLTSVFSSAPSRPDDAEMCEGSGCRRLLCTMDPRRRDASPASPIREARLKRRRTAAWTCEPESSSAR